MVQEYYSTQMADSNPRFAAAQTRQANLNKQLTDDDWTEFVDTYKGSVISSTDRVIQTKVFHLTRFQMCKMGLCSASECFRGCGNKVDIKHCFWSSSYCICILVISYYSQLSTALGLPNILYPKNLANWIQMINDGLSLYKLTFELRKKPHIFYKLWHN